MRQSVRVLGLCLALAAPAAAQDEPGSKDHPLIARMPGFYIGSYRNADFDAHDFVVKDDAEPVRVEGKLIEITYYIKDGAKVPSQLEIIRNHRNAFQKAGAKLVWADNDVRMTLRIDKPSTMWIEVNTANGGELYSIITVQPSEMTQKLEVTADELAKQLAATGSVALHNILFDTGKATIKPESADAIATVAELLKADATLKLEIQGHTDNVGAAAANLKLSQDRAAAVRQALVSQHGVAAARLTSVGLGDTKPIADNKTEEGRAQNRRVELVKK
jgi:OmpA-OmpF porin, OOP family